MTTTVSLQTSPLPTKASEVLSSVQTQWFAPISTTLFPFAYSTFVERDDTWAFQETSRSRLWLQNRKAIPVLYPHRWSELPKKLRSRGAQMMAGALDSKFYLNLLHFLETSAPKHREEWEIFFLPFGLLALKDPHMRPNPNTVGDIAADHFVIGLYPQHSSHEMLVALQDSEMRANAIFHHWVQPTYSFLKTPVDTTSLPHLSLQSPTQRPVVLI